MVFMANELNLSKSDMWMAASNAMQLGGYYVVKNILESGDREKFIPALAVGLPLIVAGSVIFSFANWSMVPTNASFLRKVISFPFPASLVVRGAGLGFVNKVKDVYRLYNVAQNTLPKLAKCAKNLSTRPLRALFHGAVHAFNLGTEVFSLGDSFGLFGQNESFSSERRGEKQNSDPSSSSQPQTEGLGTSNFEKQDPISRLTDPTLNPKNVEDAQKMLGLPNQKVDPETCRWGGYDGYIREACKGVCSNVKKAWKEIFLQVHPDKNPSPLATVASQNLNTARETFVSAYNC